MTWSFGSSMRATAPLSLSLFATLAACQAPPPATMLTECMLNSDCRAPLVCVESHCQEECVHQVDCLRGTHCTIEMTYGKCEIDVPLDLTNAPCGTTSSCPDPAQTCRDHSCWDPCTTGADCVPGSYCRNGVCANPESPGFGYGFRRPCATASDCGSGEICASDHGSQLACRRPCAADADCDDIAAGTYCAAIDDPAQPAGTMACVLGCDPVRQQGCLLHDRCEVAQAAGPSGMVTFLECRAPTGTAIAGAACGTGTPMLGTCGDNLGCGPVTSDGTGAYECRRFCVVDGDCRDASLRCIGPTVPGVENTDVVVGVLGMCAR